MKHTKLIVLALAVCLVLSVCAVSAFAKGGNNKKSAVQTENTTENETSNDKTERPERPEKPENAEDETQNPHDKHGKHGERTEEPENAIGKDAAKEIALADADVSAEDAGKVKCRVSKTEDETVVYKIHFTAGDTWYAYRIDALTGEILNKKTEAASEHQSDHGHGGHNHSGHGHGGHGHGNTSDSAEETPAV